MSGERTGGDDHQLGALERGRQLLGAGEALDLQINGTEECR